MELTQVFSADIVKGTLRLRLQALSREGQVSGAGLNLL